MEKTIYIFEKNYFSWYIDYNDKPGLKLPYAVYNDEKFKCKRATLSEALLFVIVATGPGFYTYRAF